MKIYEVTYRGWSALTIDAWRSFSYVFRENCQYFNSHFGFRLKIKK